MARTRLTAEDVQYIQSKIYDLHREKPVWRNYIPVNPNGKPPWAHNTKHYTMQDVPDGAWTLVEQNARVAANAVTGYEPTTKQFLSLIMTWAIHKNDIEISPGGRIRTDSIIKITQKMDKQIELALNSGATVSGVSIQGLLNTTGVNDGTDGNGNGMTEIYGIIKELKDLLTEDFFTDRTKWVLIHDATVDGYLDLLHATHGFSAREKLISNKIIFPDRMYQTPNLTPDTGDAVAALVESDPDNFHCLEITNGIEVHTFLGGNLDTDFMFKGYLEWAGTLVVPRPKSIAQNTGIASA